MDQRKIGAFIAQKRKELGLTQKELADRVSVTDKAVSKWENGKSVPDIVVMLALCRELNIDIRALLNGEELPEEESERKLKELLEAEQKERARREMRNRRIGFVLFIITALVAVLLVLCARGVIGRDTGSKPVFSMAHAELIAESTHWQMYQPEGDNGAYLVQRSGNKARETVTFEGKVLWKDSTVTDETSINFHKIRHFLIGRPRWVSEESMEFGPGRVVFAGEQVDWAEGKIIWSGGEEELRPILELSDIVEEDPEYNLYRVSSGSSRKQSIQFDTPVNGESCKICFRVGERIYRFHADLDRDKDVQLFQLAFENQVEFSRESNAKIYVEYYDRDGKMTSKTNSLEGVFLERWTEDPRYEE